MRHVQFVFHFVHDLDKSVEQVLDPNAFSRRMKSTIWRWFGTPKTWSQTMGSWDRDIRGMGSSKQGHNRRIPASRGVLRPPGVHGTPIWTLVH